MPRRQALHVTLVTALGLGFTAAACGGEPLAPDARPDAVGADANRDAALDASQLPDATALADATALGFGTVSGQCGELDDTEWLANTPFWFAGVLDFGTDGFDDPVDRPRLTPGGQIIVATPNAGGSSGFSEVFAFEWLARCEAATLVKTETEIVYDTQSKIADILVAIDGRKVGVSVTRAFAFPVGSDYTMAAATTLFQRKLDDIQLATASVSAADRWERQMLSVLAYNQQHAQVAMQAWQALPAATRDDTILIVTVTDGDDGFIYNQ